MVGDSRSRRHRGHLGGSPRRWAGNSRLDRPALRTGLALGNQRRNHVLVWVSSAHPAAPAQRLAERAAFGAKITRNSGGMKETAPASARPRLQADALKALANHDWAIATEHLALALIENPAWADAG